MRPPKKIYIFPRQGGDYTPYWKTNSQDEFSVEYVCKYAFIEKAWNWIEDNMLSSNQQDKSRLYYKQFTNYIKGGII